MLKEKNPQLIITFNEDAMALCLFKPSKDSNKPATLLAYECNALNYMIVQGRIMQPFLVTQHIKDFATRNNLKRYDLAFSCDTSLIQEQCIEFAKPTPLARELSAVWPVGGASQYSYLFAAEQGGTFLFYTCHTSHAYLFQLQLLGIALQKKITQITTHTMCLLQLYKHSKGVTFRQSQLAADMIAYRMDSGRFFNQDFLFRLTSISQTLSIDAKKELKFLLPALGLFLHERKSNENH
ncbi:hypothetical protein Noda2021_12310 [Candidatus Dependentiae bacterium Noda2021]|nr:hypothetical protein Noda2021_12310 [Candidatus Dependentiae bacterium Noda2021]